MRGPSGRVELWETTMRTWLDWHIDKKIHFLFTILSEEDSYIEVEKKGKKEDNKCRLNRVTKKKIKELDV